MMTFNKIDACQKPDALLFMIASSAHLVCLPVFLQPFEGLCHQFQKHPFLTHSSLQRCSLSISFSGVRAVVLWVCIQGLIANATLPIECLCFFVCVVERVSRTRGERGATLKWF